MTKYKYFGKMCKQADKANLYFRSSEKNFLKIWYNEELQWAVDMGFMKPSMPMVYLGEKSYEKYYEFTNKGINLFIWYCYPLKYKIKYWFRKIFRK